MTIFNDILEFSQNLCLQVYRFTLNLFIVTLIINNFLNYSFIYLCYSYLL